uniref:Uncharacterized protein n=1 Tax=viral metagenome TaxID=1070528 RepID=A0A6C0C4N1_9ZZZZ
MNTDLSNCPAREGFLPNDVSGCHCYYINKKKGVIDVNTTTPYNSTYYKVSRSRDSSFFPKGFPTNQRGRWNWSNTNTKMYKPNGLIVPNRLPQCSSPGDCYPDTITTAGAKQSGNIFPNTHKMSKKKLFAYLSRNRIYVNR